MPASSMNLLEVSDLDYRYGTRRVLEGLNLEVRRGQVFGLLGPNGSGKSTVLGILAGLLPAQRGEIRFEGERLERRARKFRAQLGVCFQTPSLDPHLTAAENLLLAARLHGIPRSECKRRARAELEAAELSDRADSTVGTLSGGLKRRLDLARALIHRPKLLLMDEPTAGLDEAAFRRTWRTLFALRGESDLTVLVATHRPEEAERCDRLAIIDGGKAVVVASPESLRREVADDVLVLTGPKPEALQAAVEEGFGLRCMRQGQAVLVECREGHQLIPKLVPAFEPGSLESVSLRRPSLADVFLKLTGHALDREVEVEVDPELEAAA